MAKYKCTVCGDIYDEETEGIKFEDLPDSWVCPLCGVPKYFFEEVSEDEKEVVTSNLEQDKIELINAIEISKENPAIEKDESVCIDCGMCKSICKKREGIEDINNGLACVNCGQCVQICPVKSLMPKNELGKFKQAKKDGKICIAYTSPAVRVAIGECFGMKAGTFAQGKLVSALRKLGFEYVLDVTFGADLTIMEEANELIERIKENKKLPMFTSCCPAWVKYAEINYPEILDNLSSCKSPIGMQGAIVRNYFLEKYNLDSKNVYTVAITPCTAKKYEVAREEINYTDLVLTTREIVELIKSENINFKELSDEDYDNILGEGSGAGMIFGNTGGVMEAALRTAYNILTGEELSNKKIEFNSVRGMENVREADIDINGKILKVAVVNQMSSAIPILEEVKQGKSKYHFVEIMNCLGGCVGGGGQPHVDPLDEIKFKQKRIESLYIKDRNSKIRFCHKNPDIIKIYNEFLDKPLSKKSEELLHTKYKDKSELSRKR